MSARAHTHEHIDAKPAIPVATIASIGRSYTQTNRSPCCVHRQRKTHRRAAAVWRHINIKVADAKPCAPFGGLPHSIDSTRTHIQSGPIQCNHWHRLHTESIHSPKLMCYERSFSHTRATETISTSLSRPHNKSLSWLSFFRCSTRFCVIFWPCFGRFHLAGISFYIGSVCISVFFSCFCDSILFGFAGEIKAKKRKYLVYIYGWD